MKKNILAIVLPVLFLVSMPYCKKKGSSDACSTDPSLSVTTTPANGSTEPPAPGPDFNLRVTVNSTLPSGGVTIEVKARPEANQAGFFTQTKTSTTKDTDFTITGTPPATPCIVEITVTSKACSTNKFTGSYRYSKK